MSFHYPNAVTCRRSASTLNTARTIPRYPVPRQNIPPLSRAPPPRVRCREAQDDIPRGNQHAGRTVAALQGMLTCKRLAQGGHHRVVAKALDGADPRTVATAGVSEAGARRHAVDLDSAGAAHAMLAADMRAGQQQAAA